MEATRESAFTGVKKLANQYKLLMWKNFLLLRRSPFRIVVEILWPLVLFLILAAVRSRSSLVERMSECHFHNKPMPSAGMLPFFQGIVCLSNNTCFENEVADELSGRLTSFETTGVERLVNDTATFLANDTQTEILRKAVSEMQYIANAYSTLQVQESLGDLLVMNETSFYETLESEGVPLSNRTIDLLFNNVTINSSALIDELQRIQDKDPEFIPLLETFIVDLVNLRTLLANDSQLWVQAFTEDFVSSLNTVPNISLPIDDIQDSIANGGLDLSGIDVADLLGRLQGAGSPDEARDIISNNTDVTGIADQLMDVINLNAAQRLALDDYCNQEVNQNTSACLLAEILASNGTGSGEALQELCSQARYDDLLTCTLYDFTNVSGVVEASQVADALCQHHLITDSSLCDMVEVQRRLQAILLTVDPAEVLCRPESRVLTFDSPQVENEVEPAICNLTRDQQEILLTTIVDHVNMTALRELYFPDGFDPSVLIKLATQIQQLSNMPTVQGIIADINDVMQKGFGVSFCGSAADIPLLSPLAALQDAGDSTRSPNATTIATTRGSSTTPSLDEVEEEIREDAIAEGEFQNHNSSEWRHYTHCRNLFRQMTDAGGDGDLGTFLYKQLEPILFGKIPYSPATKQINQTIKRANETFQVLATIKRTANDIRNNYRQWEVTINELGQQLETLERLLDLINQVDTGNVTGLPALVTPQEFIETLLGSSLPDNLAVPTNLTAMVEQLRILSTALESDGNIWNVLDQLGKATDMIYKYLDCVELDKFEPFDSEYALEERSVGLIKDGRYWAAIVFEDKLANMPELPSHVSYKIRMNTDKVDGTEKIEDKYWSPRPRSRPPLDTKYITYGFAYLQDMIEHSLISIMANTTDQMGIYLQQFPYPCYTVDYFTRGMSTTLPLFMILSWIFSVALLVKSIVYEKQERLKEQMKIMGLANGVHWCAWYTISFLLIVPSIILLCLIFKYLKVLQAADPSVMALLLFAFSFSTTCMAFMFSVFFTKANLAACCGAIFYFTLYLPYAVVYQYEEDMTAWMKGFSCLLSPVAFGIGTTYVARFEEQGVGIGWDNIAKSPLPGDKFNLLKCIGMLFLDGILYFLVAWYKEHVFPGKYGIPKPFYFPFTKTYWCGASSDQKTSYNVNQSASANQTASCEAEPTHLKLGVQIKELSKVYSSGKKLAVDGLSLNLYEDQITSFLGHNGAGKTTTMSILCGLFPPTEGTAVVYEKDIRHNLDEVRKSMGFCPQFNVLYEMLTVAEHILFYGQMKGLTKQEAEREMMTMLHATGMMAKKNAMTKSLSGGMKRKLSVMCAFVGGSKCVVLDEPTAGVDPYSRRQIWELLLKFKQGRTILLSTHHMDEADFLGDRIAIISHGKLCCVGSSLYLKALHGSGYYLTLVRAEEAEATSSLEGIIEKFVLNRVPGSVLMESVGQELIFQLPSSEVKTGAFATLFNDLDSNMEKLELTSYGICDTTLEEVFLKIADATGVDTEDLLTDGGTLAMPARRDSLRIKKGARRAFGKLKEKLSKLKRPSNKYARQIDDDDGASVSGQAMHTIPEADPELQNAANAQRTTSDYSVNPAEGDDTDDCLTDDEEQSNVAAGGHLSISFSSNNGQVSANVPAFSGDGESKANKLEGWRLVLHQMRGLLVKRFHHVRRDKKAFLCEIVLPAAFILLSMAVSKAVPPVHPQPPLELQPWMYEPTWDDGHLNFFYRNEYIGSNFTQSLEQLVLESQYGTRCMNPDVYEIEGKVCDQSNSILKWTNQHSDIYPRCECNTTGYPRCGAAPNMPANVTLPNNDYLLNLTGQDVSDWLVKTMQPYIKQRYGGLSFDVGGSQAYVNESHILAIVQAAMPDQSNSTDAKDISDTLEDLLDVVNIHENIKVWFNNKGWASSVSYMNAANNLLLRHQLKVSGEHSNYKDFGITAINHPMNRTDYQFQKVVANRSFVTLLVSLCVIFAMSLIPATFILYLIMDRISTSKSLQYVSGMNRLIYWVTNFIWDLFNYSVCATLCFFIFLAFNEKAYVSATNGPCLALLMLLYGWAMIPFMYPFNYIFKESSMAYVVLACMNIFLGIVSTVSTFILESYPQDEELVEISNQLKKAFLILPHYCLGRGLMDMSVEHLQTEIAEILGTTREYNPFSFDIVGKNMLALFVEGCIFFFLVIMIEYNFFYHRKPSVRPKKDVGEVDDDVRAEESAILEGTRTNDVLQTKNLSKMFKKNTAVDRVTFGVPAGQCFGLLGVNGAGKTTTFRMLTGIMSTSGGDAVIHGHSITQDPTKVQKLIGYCPQFDAIDPLLTVTEHLEYYAKLRGVTTPYVKSVAMNKLKKMGLIKYQTKRAGELSGGNKRKLQAAISLIGNPPIIFMDEPTTGMDPKARRFLWDSISKINKEGHAVILTSHSMEECEVLCNRLAIMVNGTFRCLGTPQHLKNKYGEGYHVTIRIAGGVTPDINLLLDTMKNEFPSTSTLLESSLLMAQYHISSVMAIAEIFSKLEKIRDRCMVEDYSVTQTSLDHVFIRFAKQQADSLDTLNIIELVDSSASDSTHPSRTGDSGVSQIV